METGIKQFSDFVHHSQRKFLDELRNNIVTTTSLVASQVTAGSDNLIEGSVQIIWGLNLHLLIKSVSNGVVQCRDVISSIALLVAAMFK